jgi:hypothetical protein
MILLIASLIFAVLAGSLAYRTAAAKRRGTYLWTIASVVLILPVLILLLLPPATPDHSAA